MDGPVGRILRAHEASAGSSPGRSRTRGIAGARHSISSTVGFRSNGHQRSEGEGTEVVADTAPA
eukprot:8987485-Pyramimonas_sp.AAC.1